jgi:hypothetical protein
LLEKLAGGTLGLFSLALVLNAIVLLHGLVVRGKISRLLVLVVCDLVVADWHFFVMPLLKL